jgi:SMODS and SLOG-associating 2TM effector domain 1
VSERAQQALALYRRHRLDDQLGWYEARRREFVAAARQLASLSALVLALGAGVSVLAGTSVAGKAVWAALAAVLPAVATTLSAYGALYAYERQAKIYADARRSLLLLSRRMPDLSAKDAELALGNYVDSVEDVLRREQGQWGQLLAELPLAKPSN